MKMRSFRNTPVLRRLSRPSCKVDEYLAKIAKLRPGRGDRRDEHHFLEDPTDDRAILPVLGAYGQTGCTQLPADYGLVNHGGHGILDGVHFPTATGAKIVIESVDLAAYQPSFSQEARGLFNTIFRHDVSHTNGTELR